MSLKRLGQLIRTVHIKHMLVNSCIYERVVDSNAWVSPPIQKRGFIMATRRQDASTPTHNTQGVQAAAQNTASDAMRTATDGAKSFADFAKKFKNDWSHHLAQALAFSLITAMVPIAILLLAIVVNFIGSLDHNAEAQLLTHITKAFPAQFPSSEFLRSAVNKLSSASGLLTFIAIVTALLFGSRLFTLMEVCFDSIYRLKPRTGLKKNGIAVVMLIVFVILIPVLVLASSVPGLVVSFLQNGPIDPNPNFVSRLGGIVSSLLASFLLFEAFYMFVPNRGERVEGFIDSARKSWVGAAVAAVVLQVMLLLFPLYIQFFTRGYTGQITLILVMLAFFYLFAFIILLGAEVNAYYVEGIRPNSTDLMTRASRGQ